MENFEILAKRKKNEKHFLQKNGDIVATVYSDNVHFFKEGKYEEIDNTLIKNGNFYENKNNAYKVKFYDNEDDSLIYSMSIKDDYMVSSIGKCNF